MDEQDFSAFWHDVNGTPFTDHRPVPACGYREYPEPSHYLRKYLESTDLNSLALEVKDARWHIVDLIEMMESLHECYLSKHEEILFTMRVMKDCLPIVVHHDSPAKLYAEVIDRLEPMDYRSFSFSQDVKRKAYTSDIWSVELFTIAYSGLVRMAADGSPATRGELCLCYELLDQVDGLLVQMGSGYH